MRKTLKNARIVRMIFAQTNTLRRLVPLLLLGILLAFLPWELVHAEDTAGTGSTITDFNWILTILAGIQSVITAMGFISLQVAEYFLRPEFLSGTLTADGQIHKIWMLTRDIVNIIFAVMLIGVAFYTIIMGSSAKVKEYIVYFILGVVLVNFSWFFPRVIIDLSHVLTATVYQLPSALQTEQSTTCFDGKECTMMTSVILWPTREESETCFAENPNPDEPTKCDCIPISRSDDLICYRFQPFNVKTAAGAHAMLNGLAVNYGRMTSIGKVQRSQPSNPPAGAPSGPQLDTKFFLNVLFSLVFSIALIFPIIALAAALCLRILILIFCIALMPFTFIGFVINRGKLGTNVFGIEYDVWKEFTTAAFIPFFVACAFSLGFVFLNAGLVVPEATADGNPAITINYFVNGIGNWQTLLGVVFTMMIIWGGVFTSFRSSKIIGGVTDKIKGYGEQLGNIALKAPLLIPLPTPGGGSKSLGFLTSHFGPAGINAAMEQSFRTGEGITDILGRGGATSDTEIKEASTKVQGDKGLETRIADRLEKLKDKTLSREDRDKEIRELQKALSDAGIKKASSLDEQGLARVIKDMNAKGTRLDGSGLNPTTGGTTSVAVERRGDTIVINPGAANEKTMDRAMQDQAMHSSSEAKTIFESMGIQGDASAAQKVYEEIGKQATADGKADIAGKAGKIAAALKSLPAGSTPEQVKDAIERGMTT